MKTQTNDYQRSTDMKTNQKQATNQTKFANAAERTLQCSKAENDPDAVHHLRESDKNKNEENQSTANHYANTPKSSRR